MAKMFFDFHREEERVSHLPHFVFRLITVLFLIMACALFLFRVSYLSSSTTVLASSIALMLILLIAGVRLILTTPLLFSKLVMLSSLVLFQAVEFAHSPLLNLSPITPELAALFGANAAFILFLIMMKD